MSENWSDAETCKQIQALADCGIKSGSYEDAQVGRWLLWLIQENNQLLNGLHQALGREWSANQLLDDFRAELSKAREELDKLKHEVGLLRQFGNKDCTAMADEALETI